MEEKPLTWLDAYFIVRDRFCSAELCDQKCTVNRKMKCVEWFLIVVEMWEVSNDPERNVRN